MVITKIEKTKKGRFSLFVDGEFLFSIHKDTYLTSKVALNTAVTDEFLAELKETDDYISAKDTAMGILSRNIQSSGRLKEKLRKYYNEDTVNKTVSRMEELGLINDSDYACTLARDYRNVKGYSVMDIKQRLRMRGLPPYAVAEAVAQFDESDEVAPIVEVIKKKYINKIEDKDLLNKTIAALARRGFKYDDIRRAIAAVQSELEEE